MCEENKYYKICLRHMFDKDNVFLFWGHNSSGYTKALENAGIYPKEDTTFEKQLSSGDFLVPVEKIEKLKKLIRLPIYGDKKETYGGLNEFHVLPNVGQIRKELGISILNFPHKGVNNSFSCYFEETIKEIVKYKNSSNQYKITGKQDCFLEWWYCETIITADNKNKAINQVLNSGDFGVTHYDVNFIEFKKMINCNKVKIPYIKHWVKIL